MGNEVNRAYSSRAAEYIELLGSMTAVHAARGIDLVPEFISHARNTYPGVDFALGSLEALDAHTASVGGILSWYSLIHHRPETIRIPLREFGRVLKPGGTLLVGFFEGPVVEEFAHAVTPAYRWPVDDLGAELSATGFEVVDSRVRKTTGQRPLAAIVARRLDNSQPRG
ncbi:class I SAM-dependent methyltransferase [Herbiconiux sp. P16]|uniref:class I SAM-dependent methyltransferase n=1 Tax=Herbiconiux wuyangfengii TaxID=3342794 RepID=UPI0035B7320E